MIKLGLVGCGNISNVHADRFHTLKGRMRVTATVDVDLERAREAAVQLGAEKAVGHVREILDDVDAVLLSLPHHLHHPIGMECLAAGKHVLMEKPLANTERECLDLIEASRKNNVTLMVAYCMRFHPLVRELRQLLAEKAYGDPFQVSIWTEQYTAYPPGHWATSAATLGGGQFFSHGCHYVDILLWLLGEPVRGTHLGTNFGTPWMEMEGTSNVSLEFAGGALGYHFGTWGARGSRLGYSMHAHCTEGFLEAHFGRGQLILVRGKEESVLLEAAADSKYVENEMIHFLDCIETGAAPETDGPGSLQGLRLIWRLYEAERSGTMADLRGLGLPQRDGSQW